MTTETTTLYRVELIGASNDGNWASQCRGRLYLSREAAQAAIDADETARPDDFGGTCDIAIVEEEAEGSLHCYQTGDYVRPATPSEVVASLAAGPTGAFQIDGGVYYVEL